LSNILKLTLLEGSVLLLCNRPRFLNKLTDIFSFVIEIENETCKLNIQGSFFKAVLRALIFYFVFSGRKFPCHTVPLGKWEKITILKLLR